MPSPRFLDAVHPWMVLFAPTSKPIPVVGVGVPAVEPVLAAVQAVIVQPVPVAMPDEVPAELPLRKALQWVSDDPLSAKMPTAQELFEAVQSIRFDPTPAEMAKTTLFAVA